jgi:hypothetical protein
MEYLIGLLLGAAICGVIGMAIGDLGGKKNGAAGFALGALLGPIGWIITAVLSPASDAEPKAAPEVKEDRIAKLEAELAALKSPRVEKSAKIQGKDLSDDGGIPTYKLD